MHGTQISTTETISATMPLKVSVATRSSTIPESFSMRWCRDILAADANISGPGPGTAKATSQRSESNEQSAVRIADTNAGKNASAEMAAPVTQATRGRDVVFAAPPNAAAGLDGRVAERPAAEAAVGATSVPVGVGGSSRSKRELKATASAGIAGALKPEDTSSFTGAVVTTPGVQGNVPANSHRGEVAPDLAANPSQATTTVPSAMKLGRPSTNGLPGKEASVKPGTAAGEVLASGSSNHASSMSAEPSRDPAGAKAATAAASTGTAGSSSNSDGVSPIASVLHSNQTETLSAFPQTLALNHAALPSTRADLQFQATNVADTTGIRAFHVMPSGPTQLDVGVLDGTHGWLRIRAELGAGGAVSASLTASSLAHESLRAALPEMAKYLGSEAVSVTSLAVHRFAANSNTMAAAMATSQQNEDPRGHHPRGDGAKNDGESQKHDGPESDQSVTRSASTATAPTANPGNIAGLGAGEWIRGFSSETTRQQWSFGVLEGINGSWLNVCA